MITYYCYFGDEFVGDKFIQIIFGKIKLIPLLEANLESIKLNDNIDKILIRFFLDGEISDYPQIKNSSFTFNKKKKLLIINYKLLINESKSMDLEQTYDYIKLSTLSSINLIISDKIRINKNNDFNENYLKVLNRLLQVIFENNVLG